jgi:hypothetical protein
MQYDRKAGIFKARQVRSRSAETGLVDAICHEWFARVLRQEKIYEGRPLSHVSILLVHDPLNLPYSIQTARSYRSGIDTGINNSHMGVGSWLALVG